MAVAVQYLINRVCVLYKRAKQGSHSFLTDLCDAADHAFVDHERVVVLHVAAGLLSRAHQSFGGALHSVSGRLDKQSKS